MASDKLKKGKKRICENCSTRWYDFFKKPILCPTCKQEFVETDFYNNSSITYQSNMKKIDDSKDKLGEYDDAHENDESGADDREMISIEEIEEEPKN